MKIIDPLRFIEMCWPKVHLYDKQKEIIYSVRDNDETIVPAGNGLGKDFVAALIALWFFCSRRPARVVTSSVKHDQLNDVLWGEIRNFIQSSAVELPIHYNHMKIRQKRSDGTYVPKAELVGQVVSKGEAILGRHLPRGPEGQPTTMFLGDEVSGMETDIWEKVDTWAHVKLAIFNCYPTENFARKAVDEGDLPRDNGRGYLRKVIRIPASESPNVKLAEKEIAEGKKPSGTILVPGVVDYATYMKRRRLWNIVQQTIGLDAQFYEGAEQKLYPLEWLAYANQLAEGLIGVRRTARAIGVDPGEGGANSSWAVVDELGLIELRSLKTPDTTDIPEITISLMKEHKVEPENVLFDRGGGGKQHADRLRKDGYRVRTVAFGEGVIPEKKVGMTPLETRKMQDEERYIYKNRRAELFGRLRQALDPANGGFAISRTETELLRQMRPIPYTEDPEGRLEIIPKTRRANQDKSRSSVVTLVDLLGASPDELDALTLAHYAMVKKGSQRTAGAII